MNIKKKKSMDERRFLENDLKLWDVLGGIDFKTKNDQVRLSKNRYNRIDPFLCIY